MYAIWSRPYGPSTPCRLIRRVLTICHVKLTQGTALELTCDQAIFFSKRTGKKDTWSQVMLEQKRLDFRSPALHNLWLLLVIVIIIINDLILVKHHFYLTKILLINVHSFSCRFLHMETSLSFWNLWSDNYCALSTHKKVSRTLENIRRMIYNTYGDGHLPLYWSINKRKNWSLGI